MLTRGVTVEVRTAAGIRGELAWLVDFEDPANNDWLVVNQFTVTEEYANRNERRPDLVIFLNGLPIAVFELKDPTDPGAPGTSSTGSSPPPVTSSRSRSRRRAVST